MIESAIENWVAIYWGDLESKSMQWNLGQYLVARGSDLPLRDLEIEMLPPLPNEPPKGIAEVVMIPVVPALLNAIFDATGRRFDALPVTQRMIKGVLS